MTQEEVLSQVRFHGELRGLTESTIESYLRNTKAYQNHFGKSAEQLDITNVEKYLHFLGTVKKQKPGTVNFCNASLRFLYNIVLDAPLNHYKIPRNKKTRSMPEILTREELSTLFDACSNLRDKCLFMTAYGAGLRVSEAVCLKVCDIDSKNMQIFISKGKGSRDRFAILSEVNLEILREYWKTYRPRDYLFVNLYTRCGELAISTRAAQVAFKKTLERTNVSKNATFHTLRHCFATHLLENGVGVFQIKQLLGHVDIRSTMQYCHLVKISSLDVKSPLDRLSGIHG